MPWFKRRAVSVFTLTLAVRHYTNNTGVECIDIDQKLSGGIPGGSDNNVLDFQERQYDDDIFGVLTSKVRRVTNLEEIEDDFLKTGWTEDTLADGLVHVMAWNDPNTSGYKWKAEHVRYNHS